MGKHIKKGAGGKREGAGPPLKYGEELVAVLHWVPESKQNKFKSECKKILAPWINPKKVIKVKSVNNKDNESKRIS